MSATRFLLKLACLGLAVGLSLALPDPAEQPTIDGRETARLFGCSYWSLLEQVKAGTCPVMPLTLGRKYRWPTKRVLDLLGLDPRPAA